MEMLKKNPPVVAIKNCDKKKDFSILFFTADAIL
jgi:hypothetical protein